MHFSCYFALIMGWGSDFSCSFLTRLLLLDWETIGILYLVHSNFCEKENKMHVC